MESHNADSRAELLCIGARDIDECGPTG